MSTKFSIDSSSHFSSYHRLQIHKVTGATNQPTSVTTSIGN